MVLKDFVTANSRRASRCSFAWVALVALSCHYGESPQPAEEAVSALGAATELAYVTNEDSGDLSVISTATNEVLATIPVGK